MKGSRLFWIALLGISLSGCKGRHIVDITNVNAVVTGDLADLSENEHLTTKNTKTFRVYYDADGNPREYDVLFGANPGSGETAEIWYHTSHPTVALAVGWAYTSGDKPYVEVEEVSAMSEGTTLIAQKVGAVKRIYLIPSSYAKSDQVRVKHKNDPSVQEKRVEASKWSDDRYVQFTTGGTQIEGPFKVGDASSDIQSFVRYVKQRARAAQLKDSE